MPSAELDWTPGVVEQVKNLKEYGETNPWELVDEQPVYTVTMETAQGREVKLTWLKTYKHTRTGDEREWLKPQGRHEFVFTDDWPEDNVLQLGPVEYRPYGEAPS